MELVPVEYELTLADGERIGVCELDEEVVGPLRMPAVTSALATFLDRCASMDRDGIEEAKMGYDRALRGALRSPLPGMMKAEPPWCRLRGECVMHVKDACTLRNVGRRRGEYPLCWELDPGRLTEPDRTAAILLGTAIAQAWRVWRYVVVIRG